GGKSDQSAAAAGSPVLEASHERAPCAGLPAFGADEDFLDPGDRPVRVKSEVPEAKQVADQPIPGRRDENARVLVADQRRVTGIEAGAVEVKGLGQLGG